MIDYVAYVDTDSVSGDSKIITDKGSVTIEEFYNTSGDHYMVKDDYNKKYVKKCDGYVKSFNGESIIFDKVKYVMKHKVKKHMFKIKSGSDEVVITENHSIIVNRCGELLSITPYDIKNTDKIIKNPISITDKFVIEDLGIIEMDVYDIETENTHRFFANNILVHNSNYILMDDFCKQYFGEDFWKFLSNDDKIDVIDKLSDYIKNYINRRVYDEVQVGTYCSAVDDFKINFEREKIAISGLFVKKKKYATRSLWIEGVKKEKIAVTGLDVVRSDSSEAVRSRLKDIMDMILRDMPEDDISNKVDKYKKELMDVYPEEIAANIGIKGLKKYIKDGVPKKGTPWHVKGAANYAMLISELGLDGRYEEITEGAKCKVLYLKSNPYNIDVISFIRWPEEFNGVVQPDYQVMIDKFFIKKIEMLLEPMGKTGILNKSGNEAINLFFN